MKISLISTLLLVCCSTPLINGGTTHSKPVKFRFEVDGKPANQKPRIILYFNGRTIEPEVCDDSFAVPAEVSGVDKVDLRFLSGEYDLFFESVYPSKFETDWVFGVDRKPFDKENLPQSQSEKKLLAIYYVNFVPKDGDGTRIVVEVYK